MPMPNYTPSTETNATTLFLIEHWRVSDTQLDELPLDSPAAIAQWQELMARAREDRLYIITRKAVFVGTLQAHMVLALILGALGAFAMRVIISGGS
jgi:hypothetical protein